MSGRKPSAIALQMRQRLAREAEQRPPATEVEDRRLALFERRVVDLQQRRAALIDEMHSADTQLDALPFGGGLLHDRLRAALRHRLSRIPVEIGRVDYLIGQVQNDIERHKEWQRGPTNRSNV